MFAQRWQGFRGVAAGSILLLRSLLVLFDVLLVIRNVSPCARPSCKRCILPGFVGAFGSDVPFASEGGRGQEPAKERPRPGPRRAVRAAAAIRTGGWSGQLSLARLLEPVNSEILNADGEHVITASDQQPLNLMPARSFQTGWPRSPSLPACSRPTSRTAPAVAYRQPVQARFPFRDLRKDI